MGLRKNINIVARSHPVQEAGGKGGGGSQGRWSNSQVPSMSIKTIPVDSSCYIEVTREFGPYTNHLVTPTLPVQDVTRILFN